MNSLRFTSCNHDVSLCSNDDNYICIVDHKKPVNDILETRPVDGDHFIHVFLSKIIWIKESCPINISVELSSTSEGCFCIKLSENMNSKRVPIVHLVYNASDNTIALDPLRNLEQESAPISSVMSNGHTIKWDKKTDEFQVMSTWNSRYRLLQNDFLDMVCKHLLRNPGSALQPEFYPNCSDKTMIEFGLGFLCGEVNPTSENEEEVDDWIADPHWSTTNHPKPVSWTWDDMEERLSE